ncbi:MAG: molybdopterin-dependent oxidoreductase [Candidatus Hodarchaeota archaeon]
MVYKKPATALCIMPDLSKIRKFRSVILLVLVLVALGNYSLGLEISNASDESEEIPITPNGEFFKIAIDYFDIDPEEYRLVVGGEVHNPLSLSLADIKALPVTSEIVRLTCVDFMRDPSPPKPSEPPAPELTGVANWTGVRLSTILELAEVDFRKTVDISFHTPDLSFWGYSTSLTTKEAYWDDVILAYEMNEEPLPKEHGYPLRLVCPRMFGYKWIKWVAYINATGFDYQGFWESRGYADSPDANIAGLPIYYPLTSSKSDSNIAPTSKQDSRSFGFQLSFFMTLVLLAFARFRKKRAQKYSQNLIMLEPN